MEGRVPELKSGGEFKILQAGMTPCRLVSVVAGDYPSFGATDGRTEEKIKVTFEPLGQYVQLDHEKDEKCTIGGLYRFSGHKKSNLRELVSGMSPSTTEEIYADGNKYWMLLQSMVNKVWLVAHKPSDNGKYNNIVAVFPNNQVAQPVAPVAPASTSVSQLAQAESTIDNDDIPF
jgi:hypothetical protein